MKKVISSIIAPNQKFLSLGLLILRVLVGITMLTHGLAKLTSFSELSATFPDPIGLGSTLSLILIVIGALNWGLVGIFQFDLVAAIFGGMSGVVSRIIYTLVGLAGIWGITMLFRKRSRPAFMQDDGDA